MPGIDKSVGFTPNPEGRKDLEDALTEAFSDAMAVLDGVYDAIIEDPSAFSDLGFVNQDIVDTGRFRDSKVIGTEDNGKRVVWSWNPKDPETGYPYAAALYTGFMAFGKKYVPGRPWVEKAIENVNPGEMMRGDLAAKGMKIKYKHNHTEL